MHLELSWHFLTSSFYFIQVVCLEKDRDSLRKSLLKWIKKIESGIEADGREYREILKDIFLILDENQDKKLETMEFVKLLEGNESISEVSSPFVSTFISEFVSSLAFSFPLSVSYALATL